MPFKQILLVCSERKTQEHKLAIETITSLLKKLNISFQQVSFSELNDSNFKDVDLAITLGGDGTFIKTSHFLKETPILGINSEPELSEGALTNFTYKETEKVKQVLLGNFKILKRERIEIKINNKSLKELALNEVFIGCKNQFHTSKYRIKYKDNEEEQRSSGVLISTASGSTAWYKSAGGTPFQSNEKLKFLIREPYSGRVFQPKILNGEITNKETLKIEYLRHEGGVLSIDSNNTKEIDSKDKIELSISDKPLNVLII